MRRRFPRSLWLFLILPLSILNFLAGLPVPPLVFVTPLVLYIGLLGAGFEALRGRVSRWWLLPLIAVLAICYATVAMERRVIASAAEEAAASLAAHGLRFDPDQQVLMVPQDYTRDMLSQFDLAVVYSSEASYSYRLIDQALCEELRQVEVPWSSGIAISPYRAGEVGRAAAGDPQNDRRPACLLVMPELPEQPVLRIETVKPGGIAAWPEATLWRVETVRDGKTVAAEVPYPNWKPLPWWPDPGRTCLRLISPRMLQIGCVPLDLFDALTGPGARLRGLAPALGLQEVDPSARRAADPDPVRRKFVAAVARALDK